MYVALLCHASRYCLWLLSPQVQTMLTRYAYSAVSDILQGASSIAGLQVSSIRSSYFRWYARALAVRKPPSRSKSVKSNSASSAGPVALNQEQRRTEVAAKAYNLLTERHPRPISLDYIGKWLCSTGVWPVRGATLQAVLRRDQRMCLQVRMHALLISG